MAATASVAALSLVPATAWAADAEAEVECGTDAQLVWRGLALARGPVITPAARVEVHGLRLEGEAALAPRDTASRGEFGAAELSYVARWSRLELSPSASLFGGGGSPATGELSLIAAWALGAMRVESVHHVDVRRAPGAYFGSLGLAYERSWARVTLGAMLDVAWASSAFNAAYFGVDHGAFELAELGASARVELTDVVYLAAHVEVSGLLGSGLARAAQQGPWQLNGGAALGFAID